MTGQQLSLGQPAHLTPGAAVKWFARTKPAGWHYGSVMRIVTRGRFAGKVEIACADGGRVFRDPADLYPQS